MRSHKILPIVAPVCGSYAFPHARSKISQSRSLLLTHRSVAGVMQHTCNQCLSRSRKMHCILVYAGEARWHLIQLQVRKLTLQLKTIVFDQHRTG